MAEYTEAISGIGDKLDSLLQAVEEISETVEGFQGDSGLVVDNTEVVNKLQDVITALGSTQTVTVDYSDKLQQLSELMVYTDILLIVLLVFAVLGVGFLVGSKITDRLRLGG